MALCFIQLQPHPAPDHQEIAKTQTQTDKAHVRAKIQVREH